MSMKVKLIVGLGFLFAMIFALTIFCSYYIEKLAEDSNNILKDNYKSIEYTKNMLSNLDEMDNYLTISIFIDALPKESLSDISNKIVEFEKNFEIQLTAEANNITEKNENEFVDTLKQNFSSYKGFIYEKILKNYHSSFYIDYLAEYISLKNAIDKIYIVNVDAIFRKNQIAKSNSDDFRRNMAIFGVFFIILAFGYFWYFPFYVSNSLNILSVKSKKLLSDLNIDDNIKSKDEFGTILNCLNSIEDTIHKT